MAEESQPGSGHNGGWSGQERRGIQMHVINYIDERLGVHTHDVKQVFNDHTREEMERYKDILDAINSHRDAVDKQHVELSKSIEAYMNRMNEMYGSVAAAFVVDKKGKPDFAGHATAHEKMIETAKEMEEVVKYAKAQIENDREKKELYSYVRKVAVASAAVAVISWLTLVVWPAVLQGPK